MSDFLKTRTGMVLTTFLVIAGAFLAFEHRMHIFTGNGVIIALLAVCIGMHVFMHGSHGGGHGRRDRRDNSAHDEDEFGKRK